VAARKYRNLLKSVVLSLPTGWQISSPMSDELKRKMGEFSFIMHDAVSTRRCPGCLSDTTVTSGKARVQWPPVFYDRWK